MPAPADNVLSPSQLNALARSLLEDAFPLVLVEGEIGNLARPASGHLYLTLKDERAQVRCALFRPKSQWLNFQPRDGMRDVRIIGRFFFHDTHIAQMPTQPAKQGLEHLLHAKSPVVRPDREGLLRRGNAGHFLRIHLDNGHAALAGQIPRYGSEDRTLGYDQLTVRRNVLACINARHRNY